jgi:hypothetical protein
MNDLTQLYGKKNAGRLGPEEWSAVLKGKHFTKYVTNLIDSCLLKATEAELTKAST